MEKLRALASSTPSLILIQFNSHQNVKPPQFFRLSSSHFRGKPTNSSNLTLRISQNNANFQLVTEPDSWDFHDEEIEFPEERDDEDEKGCPWEGAVIYKRNPTISHLEYCTTLERLGLGKHSSECSRTRASEMGLRVTKSVEDYTDGTPVLVSVDVTRKKQKLRLDGIVRTVLTLACDRCGEPAAESVYSNFSLLLTEEPIQESDTINMGVVFGEDKFKSFTMQGQEAEDDEYDASVDLDDQLYFPPEEKIIDISKNIRDLIHVEITINALCGPSCKGLCLRCGTNLNFATCNCRTRNDNVDAKGYGPLKELRKQMQQM